MVFFRKHWWDIGGILAIAVLIFVYVNLNTFSSYQLLMYLSLVSLFFHQSEEYRIVGTFPGMINTIMYKSKFPDRYPLNANTAFIINVFIGWVVYFMAAIFAERAFWLGIATIIISLGNVIAHTFVFNIKGKTFYNAGMATCWLFFVPVIYFFWKIGFKNNLISINNFLIGVPLGIVLNVVGILKMIDWLANENTPYVFDRRHLLYRDRNPKP